jgi:NTP pyrophosphatase (non-canonical NTP hydrolase)
MNITVHDIILLQANRCWPDDRLRKCTEELTELSLALHHSLDDREDLDHIAEEMADVLLSIRGTMLKLRISEHVIAAWMQIKADRLLLRLPKESRTLGE